MIASPLYNRAYLALCLWHSAKIPFRGTSHTHKTLGEIAFKKKNRGD